MTPENLAVFQLLPDKVFVEFTYNCSVIGIFQN